MYEFIDYLVDLYFPLLETWDDSIESLESKIIVSNPPKNIVNRIMSIKRELLSTRKSMIPQRDLIAKMIRADIPFIRPKTKVYLKDVYDHIMLVYSELEIQRDILNSTFEAYVSLVSNQTNTLSIRMNEIMQKLTVIATIFMPLTFVASLYGMNFKNIPLSEWKYGFESVIIICLVLGVALYFYFKKKRWME
jgi:magnesium transporter